MVYSLSEPSEPIHACLLECVQAHLRRIPELAADLKTFDKKMKSGAMTRCPRECAVQ